MSDLKINIHARNDNNDITDKNFPEKMAGDTWLSAQGGGRANRNMRIVFESSSLELLFDEIKWGSKYKQGDVEQAGLLIGKYYRDTTKEDTVIWGDVVVVIPADASLVSASKYEILIPANAWRVMREKADEYRTENLQILGWYHTHPDEINTRFSGTDKTTQKQAFSSELSFGVVFNPNQKCWSVFYGAESEECVGELILPDTLLEKYGEPKIQIKQVNGDSELQEDGSVVHYDDEGRIIDVPPIVPISNEPQILNNNPNSPSILSSILNGVGRKFIAMSENLQNSPKRKPQQNTMSNGNSIIGGTKKNPPKIKVKGVNNSKQKIEFSYCSLNPNNTLIELDNQNVKFSKKNIMNIIYDTRKRRSINDTLNDTFYGELNHITEDGKLIIALNNCIDMAQVKIRFLPSKQKLTIKSMIENSSQISTQTMAQNIQYLLIINDNNPSEIDVIVVHIIKGKTI